MISEMHTHSGQVNHYIDAEAAQEVRVAHAGELKKVLKSPRVRKP